MSNRRFYCNQDLSLHSIFQLPENVAIHALRVLRLNVGDNLVLFNGNGFDYQCTLTTVKKNENLVQVNTSEKINNESWLNITLLQGISSGDRMDITLQKAVELGVTRIVPIKTERSVVKLSTERIEKRTVHWQQVIIAACEQSGRAVLPTIDSPLSLDLWLAANDDQAKLRLVLDPAAGNKLKEVKYQHQAVEILVGPEGGLSANELKIASQHGFTGVKIGERILRTETAPLAALAAIQALWGDF